MSSGVDLIIHDLETTKLGFTQGFLHGKLIMDINGFEEKCVYCGEGVLAYKSGINKNRLTNMHILHEIKNYDFNETKMFKRYGIHFTDFYPNDKGIKCPKCFQLAGDKQDLYLLRSLEIVVTHLNDVHSHSHKELAQNLHEVNMIYNLATGEKRK